MLSGGAAAMRQGVAQAQQAASPDPSGIVQVTPDKLLLKDYRPRSIYKVPRTEVHRAKYPVTDVHSHAEWVRSPEQLGEMVKTMDEANVEKAVMFIRPGIPEKFSEAGRMFSKYPGRFDLWCGFDLTGFAQPGFGPNAVKALEQCHRLGALGVGEIHDKGRGFGGRGGPGRNGQPQRPVAGMHPDDSRMDAIYHKCAELGMPINVHVSDPIWSYQPMDNTNDGLMNGYTWTIKPEPGVMGHDELIESLERAVHKHPKTVFVACHLANLDYDLTRLGQMFDRNPNLYADIGARFGETAPIPRFVSRFFQKYPDRVLYGTDMAYNPQMLRVTFRILETLDEHFYVREPEVQSTTGGFDYHWPLYGFGLPDDVLKKVYRENARNMYQRARNGKP
jgi:predicted TIM-barrel fold metal-dependent hydrolase